MEVYFDNAATTKILPEVIEEVSYGMKEYYMNPSSLHKLGIKGEKKLNECREVMAKFINASKEEIYFTSGGTEGNNLVLKGLSKGDHHLIISFIEHSSILKTAENLEKNGAKVTILQGDKGGKIDLEELKEIIRKDTVLVSIMHVNNEIGVIQSLEEIGKVIKECSSRAKFHVDAVQSFGKIFIDVKKMNIDILTASAHKIHGPKGVGFIYIKKGVSLTALIEGGEQEGGLRAGTHNLPGIMGFCKASSLAFSKQEENYKYVWDLKKYMLERLEKEIGEIVISAPLTEEFSPYILNVSFIGVRGEVLLHLLEDRDIFVSTGSACSSKTRISKGSHVLRAINKNSKEIESAVRFSYSVENTKEEIDFVVETLKQSLGFLRRIRK
ncbi:MAG: cysteine desulfurase family protein [Clostridium sp.]